MTSKEYLQGYLKDHPEEKEELLLLAKANNPDIFKHEAIKQFGKMCIEELRAEIKGG